MSNYIYNRAPNRFGNHQADYLAQVEQIVESAASSFHQTVSDSKDLEQLFHKTLSLFGKKRKEIARQHGGDVDAESFGVRRDQAKSGDSVSFAPVATTMGSPYEEYNKKLLSLFKMHLRKMRHSKKEYFETELVVPKDSFSGRKFHYKLQIMPYEKREVNLIENIEECYRKLCKLLDIDTPYINNEGLVENFTRITHDETLMRKLKKVSPQDYERVRMTQAANTMKEEFKSQKISDWIVITPYMEIDENKPLLPLSQYLLGLFRDLKTDPLDDLETRVTTIIHQDSLLVDKMLTDVAKVFKRCIEWNKKDLRVLKRDVALFEYELSHAMPFLRGTSAISEWFEMAIYRFHGYKLNYNQNKLVNLEALTSTYQEFVESYDSMVSLNKLGGDQITPKDNGGPSNS